MLTEAISLLSPAGGRVYVDATFGAGGYAEALLHAAPCTVIGVDRDPAACARGEAMARQYSGRLRIIHGCFGGLVGLIEDIGIMRIDGIAFDLGMSSIQLDDATRGFSFRFDGPADMRMDPTQGVTAADIVNTLPEMELARIFREFGEERAARRIAAELVRVRADRPIAGTRQLADVIRRMVPSRGSETIDRATRGFQALRIVVNDELAEIDRGLLAAEHLLQPGGRLVVVAFHSLEDRRVKTFLRARSGTAARSSRHRPVAHAEPAPTFRLITSRAIRPSPDEVANNPRSRSARLRAAERTDAPAWPDPTIERKAA
jgi:16S rRNA (cytosine1402-N4)-methyltransferase